MIDTINVRHTHSKPDFSRLMNLYENNYRLLSTLLEYLDDNQNSIRNKNGYTLKIHKKHQTRYTQNIDLHYSFHTQRRGRKIIVAIASFKVRLYLDTRQVEVVYSEVQLKNSFSICRLFLSLQTKWYYNQCLRAVLRSFFTRRTSVQIGTSRNV